MHASTLDPIMLYLTSRIKAINWIDHYITEVHLSVGYNYITKVAQANKCSHG